MWYALNMLGRSEDALAAAKKVVEKAPVQTVRQAPPLEYFSPTVLFTLARFSKWDEILRQPAPVKDLRYTTGVWRYVRGLAYAGQHKLDSARVERDSLAAIRSQIPPEQMANLNSAKALLAVAEHHVAGEIAATEGRTDEALEHLKQAIAGEDELIYDEPPPWYLPMRQRLGAVLLAASRPAQAEWAYRQDLVRRPNNGWSLYGLAASLKAQNRAREAAAVEAEFKKAWKSADVEVSGEAGKRESGDAGK
jgi:tetratricopeptide (TPR) repeat protein